MNRCRHSLPVANSNEPLSIPEVEPVTLSADPQHSVRRHVERGNHIARQSIRGCVVMQLPLVQPGESVQGGDPEVVVGCPSESSHQVASQSICACEALETAAVHVRESASRANPH